MTAEAKRTNSKSSWSTSGLVGLSPAGLALLLLEALGGFEVDAAEGVELVLGQDLLDGLLRCSSVRSVYWSSWVWRRCTSLNCLMNAARASSPLRLGTCLGLGVEALRLHEVVEVCDGGLELFDDLGGLVDEPDFAGLVGLGAGEERDGGIDGVLLAAEVEDVAVGLGGVEHAVGAGEGLDQAVVLEVLVDVERVEVLGVEAGEQHVDDDGDVDLLAALLRQVGVGELLVLDALLDVLVVEVELVDASGWCRSARCSRR